MKQASIPPFLRRFLAASTIACLTTAGSAMGQPPLKLKAVSWLLVDGESGQTLTEHNADARRQPASLTKLMTAYVVLDALKRGLVRWDEMVTVGQADVSDVGGDEAKMYLHPGQRLPVKPLVQGLIAASANDAALVLAERIGGSLGGFEMLMNAKARELGLEQTHFSTPSGITTPGNYSTARDLSILAVRLTKEFPEYYAFSSEEHFSFGKFKKRNKNWLLSQDPSVDGMKTGHTEAAGYCIVATAKRKQTSPPMMRRVFAIVLGAPTAPARLTGARSLLDYGFSDFIDYPVVDANGQHVVTRGNDRNLVYGAQF